MDDRDLVKQLSRALLREAAAAGAELAERTGLGATDRRALRVLDALAGPVPLTPGRLAEHVGLSAPATTALVDRLVAADRVERVRDLPDRRQVRLALTATARRFGQEVLAPLGLRIDAAVDGLSAEDAAVVAAFLGRTLPHGPEADG